MNNNRKFAPVCFTDASQDGMCATVYVRYECNTGKFDIGLVTAKTKVALGKKATMPYLELCTSLL